MTVDLSELERLERDLGTSWYAVGNAVRAGLGERLFTAEHAVDAQRVAAARNALPELIAEARILRARVAELEKDAALGAAVREAVERVEGDHVAGHLLQEHYCVDGREDGECSYCGREVPEDGDQECAHRDIVITEDKLDVLRAIDALLAEEEEGADGE